MEGIIKQRDYPRMIKDLDASIQAASASGRQDSNIVARMYCNKGFCHQKLNLNRKALKVANCPEFFSRAFLYFPFLYTTHILLAG